MKRMKCYFTTSLDILCRFCLPLSTCVCLQPVVLVDKSYPLQRWCTPARWPPFRAYP